MEVETRLDPAAALARLLSGIQLNVSDFAECTKVAIAEREPDAASYLDFNSSAVFLEPLLFAYFAVDDSPIPIGQILYGYLSGSSRPTTIQVVSDKNGLIVLPGLGELVTSSPNATFQIVPGISAPPSLMGPEGETRVNLTPPVRLDGSTVELAHSLDPLTAAVIEQICPNASRVTGVAPDVMIRTSLSRAVQILNEVVPEWFAAIDAVTRRIVLFSGTGIDSFATTQLFGTARLRVEGNNYSSAFFIEELAHQCGHIMFAALTQNRDEFFIIDPSTPLREITGQPAEYRDLDVLFHAVFTECAMSECLGKCLERANGIESFRHEALGRLGFSLRRLYLDLRTLDLQGVFTPKGQSWFRLFSCYFQNAYTKWAPSVENLKYTNQGYGFDPATFVADNRGAAAAR